MKLPKIEALPNILFTPDKIGETAVRGFTTDLDRLPPDVEEWANSEEAWAHLPAKEYTSRIAQHFPETNRIYNSPK